MKKSLFKVITTILLTGGVLTLTACDHFLQGPDVKNEILNAISYNNAKEIPVLIQSQVNTGTTVPSGNHTAKQGYDFEISFTEASEFSFEKWIAVAKDNPDQIITDGVIFADQNASKTKVRILNDTIPLCLIPKCTDRITLSVEPTPRFDSAGVGRDRSIVVEFTKELSEQSFIFSESELPKDAVPVKDSAGDIWAYTKDSQTFLKNITITTPDGLSLGQYFTKPLVEGRVLTVQANKEDLIPFEVGETSKTIIVTLSKNICDIKGVTMSSDRNWRYRVVEASDDKATINFTGTSGEGSINAVSKTYYVGQESALSFTENNDYQFIKWEYDPSIVLIKDPYSADTTLQVKEKLSESEASQVKAICAQRLRAELTSVQTGATVCKNTPIQLTFNHNLPLDAEGLAQLENISITIGGNSVKDCFISSNPTGGTLTFTADPMNLINVPTGQTKTVVVSIPASLYYEFDDEAHTKVTYGGIGKSFTYKINDSTNERAIINFVQNNTGSGSITVKPVKENNSYSLEDQIEIKFTPNENYQFNGWKILDGLSENELTDSSILIEEPDSLSTVLYVKKENKSVKVVAATSEKLKVSEYLPTAAVSPKDKSIEITFNKNLDAACGTDTELEKIQVTMDGVSVDSYFTRELNENKITLSCKKYLPVTEAKTAKVRVLVPSSFYYMDGLVKINLEQDCIFEYAVNSTTIAKAYASFTSPSGSGTLSAPAGTNEYSMGQTVSVSFEPNEGYKFLGWLVSSEALSQNENINDYVKIEDAANPQTLVTFEKSLSGIVVAANVSELAHVSFELTGPSGDYVPAKGQKECYESNIYPLSFDPEDDYEFIRWEIYDKALSQTVENRRYITIADPKNKSTTYQIAETFPQSKDSIIVRPVVVERPWIISNSPMISGGLSLKDSAIQVIFDHDMDEESICYTEAELDDIMAALGIVDENDERLLKTKVRKEITVEGKTTVQEVERVCGYKQDDEYIYKNISITDFTEGTNLNKCFTPPVFETKRILSISANLDSLPQDYTQIFVNIDKNFFYNEQISENETKPITMPKSLKWIYQVSNERDTSDPVVTTAEVKVFEGKFEGESLPNTWSGKLEDLICFTKNMYINLNLVVTDVGTGPSASFEIQLTKVKNEKYEDVTPVVVYTKKYNFQYTTSQNGGYNTTADLDYFNNGVYYMTIIAKDKTNRSGFSENFYYGVGTFVDKPNPTEVSCLSSSGSEPNTIYNYKITFTTPKNNSNCKFLKIQYGWSGSSITLSGSSVSAQVLVRYNYFDQGTNYINCWYEDDAGNKSEEVRVDFEKP